MTTSYVRRLLSIGIIKALLLLVVCGSFGRPGDAQEEDSPFAGNWTGTIMIDPAYGTDAAEQRGAYQLRISPKGRVRVYHAQGSRAGRRRDLLPMAFVLTELRDGAFIAGQGEDNFWVVARTFNLTKIDDDRMLVYLWVVIDTFDVPSETVTTLRAGHGYGEFQRENR